MDNDPIITTKQFQTRSGIVVMMSIMKNDEFRRQIGKACLTVLAL